MYLKKQNCYLSFTMNLKSNHLDFHKINYKKDRELKSYQNKRKMINVNQHLACCVKRDKNYYLDKAYMRELNNHNKQNK